VREKEVSFTETARRADAPSSLSSVPNQQHRELEPKFGASALQLSSKGGGGRVRRWVRGTWNKKKLILLGISVTSKLLLGSEQRMGGWGSSTAVNKSQSARCHW